MATGSYYNPFFRQAIQQPQTCRKSDTTTLNSSKSTFTQSTFTLASVEFIAQSSTGEIPSSSATETNTFARVQSSELQSNFSLNGLLCYYQNLGGINTSLTEYLLACSDAAYDIYAFTETWLKNTTPSSTIFGNVYSVFRTDRSSLNSSKSTGGGVLLAVRSTLKCRLLQPPNCHAVEQLWVALPVSHHTLYICIIYIPPDRINDPLLTSQHSDSLDWITSQMNLTDKILILGDFNMSSISWTTGSSNYLYPNYQQSKINTSQC